MYYNIGVMMEITVEKCGTRGIRTRERLHVSPQAGKVWLDMRIKGYTFDYERLSTGEYACYMNNQDEDVVECMIFEPNTPIKRCFDDLIVACEKRKAGV